MLVACDAPIGLAVPLEHRPTLAWLSLEAFTLRDGGVLAIEAEADDPRFRLPRGTYLTLDLTTSRGDSEELRLERLLCGVHWCHRVDVHAKDGISIPELEQAIRTAGGRLTFVGAFNPPSWGAAWVLNGRVPEFRDRLLLHPNIDFVDFDAPTWAGFVDDDYWQRLMGGGVPLSTAPVVARDGTLSVLVGDTVRARYIDASGGVLEQSWVIPGLNNP